MNNNIPQGKKALVIGGGIAGLVVARVLSDHYENVQVIERDSRPEEPGTRPGVSQSFHLHQILPRGEVILQNLVPGYKEDLQALGAYQFHEQTEIQMINPYGAMPFPGGGDGDENGVMVTYSRGLLEWVLREHVQKRPNVHFLYHHEVINLVTTTDGTHTTVTGVTIRERGQVVEQRTLEADLVVEASGRSSKLPQWLSALGFEIPESERVTANIGYSTRYYKAPAHKKNLGVTVVESDPVGGNSAGGVVKAIENDIWTVCLTSINSQYPSTNAKEFDEGFKNLVSPALAELLQDAEPLTEPRGYRIPECVRHHYEKMEQWPAGLLVVGDSFCHFDPIYGQGMTVAAIQAETLAASLREEQGQPGFERRVLQRLQDAIYPAWWRSAIEDLRWSGVTYSGPEPIKGLSLLHKYFDLCLKQSTRLILKQMETGEFNPMSMNYFMMNWMFIPPRAVINTAMLDVLLQFETPEEKQTILADLFAGYDQNNIEAVFDEIVPAFSYNFGEQEALSA